MSLNLVLNDFFLEKKKILKKINKKFINSCIKEFQKNFKIPLSIRYLYTKSFMNQKKLDSFLFSNVYKKFYFRLSNEFCLLVFPCDFILFFFQYFYGNKKFFSYTLKNAMNLTDSEKKIFYLLSRKILNIFFNSLNRYFQISMYDVFINQKIDINFFDFFFKKKYLFFYYEVKYNNTKNIFNLFIPEKIFKYIDNFKDSNFKSIIHRNNKFWNMQLVKKISYLNLLFFAQFEDFYISLYRFYLLKIGDVIEISAFRYIQGYINNCLFFLATWDQDDNFYFLYIKKFFNFYYNIIFHKGKNMCIKNIDMEELKENNHLNSLNKKRDNKNFKSDFKFNNSFKNKESLEGFSAMQMNEKNVLKGLERFLHIPMKITVELGKTQINMQELLNLNIGSIIKLKNEIHKSQLNIYANDCLIAKGELVMTDKKYGIRVTKIFSF